MVLLLVGGLLVSRTANRSGRGKIVSPIVILVFAGLGFLAAHPGRALGQEDPPPTKCFKVQLELVSVKIDQHADDAPGTPEDWKIDTRGKVGKPPQNINFEHPTGAAWLTATPGDGTIAINRKEPAAAADGKKVNCVRVGDAYKIDADLTGSRVTERDGANAHDTGLVGKGPDTDPPAEDNLLVRSLACPGTADQTLVAKSAVGNFSVTVKWRWHVTE